MRLILAALMLCETMATLPQMQPCTNSPRIMHGHVSSTIHSYPSLGGYVRKKITRVELDWLGIKSPTNSSDSSTFKNNTQASYDAHEEDTLALRMLQLGAHWWPDRYLYDRHRDANGYAVPYGHHFPPDVDVCYPSSGGLLVLRTWAGNSLYLDGLPGVAPEAPAGWSRLSLCANMEERCEVLREFGAVYFRSVEECPDVPETLEEGVAQGKEYERLLKLMEDMNYVDRWLGTCGL
jgi:hypothetical protein